ncbi:MAG TPA: hypothetical protein VGL06_06990, partial [Pseudonocardiaceae bacterium]
SGGTAYWRLTATNTGGEDLTGITVVDKTEPSCADNAGAFSLGQGASTQFFCSTANVTAGMTNTAVAVYTPPDGQSTASEPAQAAAVVSNLAVTKEACRSQDASACGPGGVGPWAKAAVVPSGGTAFWRITATNTGEVDLTGITLADKTEPSCATAAGTFGLAVGASNQVFCSTSDLTGQVVNTVTAAYVPPGTPEGTPPVSTPPDSATVNVSDLVVAKEVCQSENPTDCGPDGQGPWGDTATAGPGGTVFWRITVTNNSDGRVDQVTLDDAKEPSCGQAAGVFGLDAGASARFFCSTQNVTGDITNTAVAVFLLPGRPPVSSPPATATVLVPHLTVTKWVCQSTMSVDCGPGGNGPWGHDRTMGPGGTAFWRITITNDGNAPVTASLWDQVEYRCVTAAGTFDLAAGAHRDVYCATADVTTDIVNTALAAFLPVHPAPGIVPIMSAPDSASVHVVRPAAPQPTSSGQSLAYTGFPLLPMLLTGMAALAGGLVVWRTARRR